MMTLERLKRDLTENSFEEKFKLIEEKVENEKEIDSLIESRDRLEEVNAIENHDQKDRFYEINISIFIIEQINTFYSDIV